MEKKSKLDIKQNGKISYINNTGKDIILEPIYSVVRNKEIKPMPYVIATVGLVCFITLTTLIMVYTDYEALDSYNVSISSILEEFPHSWVFVPLLTIIYACFLRLIELSGLTQSCAYWWAFNFVLISQMLSFLFLAFIAPASSREQHIAFAIYFFVTVIALNILIIFEYQKNQKRQVYDGNFVSFVIIAILAFVSVTVIIVCFATSFSSSKIMMTVFEFIVIVLVIFDLFILARIANMNLYGQYPMVIKEQIQKRGSANDKKLLWSMK